MVPIKTFGKLMLPVANEGRAIPGQNELEKGSGGNFMVQDYGKTIS